MMVLGVLFEFRRTSKHVAASAAKENQLKRQLLKASNTRPRPTKSFEIKIITRSASMVATGRYTISTYPSKILNSRATDSLETYSSVPTAKATLSH